MGKTYAQELIEEGKELGVVMAKQEDLIKLLNSKFGLLPQNLTEKIRSIHQVDQLDAIFDRALIAETIDEVFLA